MKTQLWAIVALLALIVLHLYVPTIYIFWPWIMDHFVDLFGFVIFIFVVSMSFYRKLKAANHG